MKVTVVKKRSKMKHINKGFGYDDFFDIGCSLNLNKSIFDNVIKEQEHCEDAKVEGCIDSPSTMLTIVRYPLYNCDSVITIDEQCSLIQLISMIKSNLPKLCDDYSNIKSQINVLNKEHRHIFDLIVNSDNGIALYDGIYYVNDAKWEEIKRDKFKIKPNNIIDPEIEFTIKPIDSEYINKLANEVYNSCVAFARKNWINAQLATNSKCDTDVLKFIYQFEQRGKIGSTDNIIHDVFRSGYCWHFAHMLKTTFARGVVCLAYPFGHFVWKDVNGVTYDIEGEYLNNSEAYYCIPEEYLTDEVLDNFRHIPDCDGCNTTKEQIQEIEKRYVNDIY